MNEKTKVVTGRMTRFSYVHVDKPVAMVEGGAEKYSVSLIIPKSDKETISDVRRAIKAAYDDGLGKLKGNSRTAPTLESLRAVLRDGDTDKPDDEAYRDSYFVNAKSVRKPYVCDSANNEIIDCSEIYSGCYGRASISFYAYNTGTSRGIACSLNGLQKIKDGEPLGGMSSAKADFKAEGSSNDDGFLD